MGRGWTLGWRAHDPEPIAALHAADGVFLSHPFREPLHGPDGAREYARRAFAEEDAAEFRFAEPVVDGRRAAIEYWAVLTVGGREQTLAGTSVLHFDEEDWVLVEGTRQPAWGT